MLRMEIPRDNKRTLLEILREQNNDLSAVCAGRGTCGKCRVRILQGEVAVTEADRSFFSEAELQAGWRLSCKCIPTEDLAIEICGMSEEGFEMLGTGMWEDAVPDEAGNHGRFILGIDIGTTTIAMALQEKETGRIVEEYLCLNSQRVYGADVVSRIQASVEGKGAELQKLIRGDLWKGICQVTHNAAVLPEKIVIAANTTMIHLLMGYPCKGLGQYPFTPHHIGEIHGSAEEILGAVSGGHALNRVSTHILSGISTFVGADIVADMLVCDMAGNDEISVLIDVGTNGEMAIGNRDKMLVSSTAAGPAFEGGNISWGIGSVPGAICGMENTNLKTIREKPPIGICGTGVIEVVYELLQTGILDETGYMEQEEFVLAETGDGKKISFTQKDVRQLQLAKAAIRAGVETLLLRYGVTAEEVDTVYLAGGFGYHMNVEKAMGIGLFPDGFEGKIKLLGNGSLLGALQYGREVDLGDVQTGMDGIQKVIAISEEIHLATDKDFNELYLEYMGFERTRTGNLIQ